MLQLGLLPRKLSRPILAPPTLLSYRSKVPLFFLLDEWSRFNGLLFFFCCCSQCNRNRPIWSIRAE